MKIRDFERLKGIIWGQKTGSEASKNAVEKLDAQRKILERHFGPQTGPARPQATLKRGPRGGGGEATAGAGFEAPKVVSEYWKRKVGGFSAKVEN